MTDPVRDPNQLDASKLLTLPKASIKASAGKFFNRSVPDGVARGFQAVILNSSRFMNAGEWSS